MSRVPDGGLFRTPQSFTLLTARQLLDKLRWDLQQLEELRWNEDLGASWRQAVSYKAVECATSIWHLAEWIVEDIQAVDPEDRIRSFLALEVQDPWEPISVTKLRKAALKHCPDLEICRVVAIAAKHYKVKSGPRPDIRTEAYLALAHLGSEPFMRPVMWLAVWEGDVKRDMREVFHNCLRFWEALSYVAQPGSSWQPGHSIPEDAHIALEPPLPPIAKQDQPSLGHNLRSKLEGFFRL